MLTKLRYDLKLSPDAPRPFIIRTHTSWPAHPFPGGTVCRPFLRQHNFTLRCQSSNICEEIKHSFEK